MRTVLVHTMEQVVLNTALVSTNPIRVGLSQSNRTIMSDQFEQDVSTKRNILVFFLLYFNKVIVSSEYQLQ